MALSGDTLGKALIELKHQVQAGQAGHRDRDEGLLGASGASLVYAGYPYDPFALDAPKS